MNPTPPADISSAPWTFPRKVLLVGCALLLALLAWQLADLFMLVFGGVIVAVVLRVLANALERYLRLPGRWSVLSALALVVLATEGGLWLLGDPLGEQVERLRDGIPTAREAVLQWLNDRRVGAVALELFEQGQEQAGLLATRIAGFVGLTFGAIGSALLIVVMGVYLALSPQLYRNGLIRLLPVAARDSGAQTLDACGSALSSWLLGQSLSMLFVGVSTAVGRRLLGVPLAFSVGVMSGLLVFIPYIGAIIGGVLLATPAMVVAMVLVERLYIKGALESLPATNSQQ